MQSERVTFLTTPDQKARLAKRAASRGVSVGEYVRRKVEEADDELTPEQEKELTELVRQANVAIPQMARSLDEMSAMLRRTREEIDQTLREAGIHA